MGRKSNWGSRAADAERTFIDEDGRLARLDEWLKAAGRTRRGRRCLIVTDGFYEWK
jgi:putative SOS response-associated peptidase YedK